MIGRSEQQVDRRSFRRAQGADTRGGERGRVDGGGIHEFHSQAIAVPGRTAQVGRAAESLDQSRRKRHLLCALGSRRGARDLRHGRRARRYGFPDLHRNDVGHGAEDHLQRLVRRADHSARAQRLEPRFVHRAVIDDDEAQARGAGGNFHQIAAAAQRGEVGAAARVAGRVLSGGQGRGRGRSRHILVLASGGLEVQLADGESENAVIDREIDQPHRQQQQRARRLAEVQDIVEQARRKPEAQMHAKGIGQPHRKAGQHRVDRVKHRCEEHEAEFDGLGNAGQQRSQGQAEEHAAHRLAPLGPRRAVHRQAGRGQAEHHDREEAGHEAAGGRIAREEAADVAVGAVVVAKHEPEQVVEDVMEARHQ